MLSIGIVGLPNVGKSTLFKLITQKKIDCANYPFCTIEPNIGVVVVPDERLDLISQVVPSKKKTYSAIEFVDIAGLVEGASQGKGLGNKFLANIRETSLIVYVLRAFQEKEIVSVRNEIDPLQEAELLETELALKDLETLDKRIHWLEKEHRSGRKTNERDILIKARKIIEESHLLSDSDFDEETKKTISNLSLLASKPRIYLVNGKEEEISLETRNRFKNKNFLIVDINNPDSLVIDELIRKSYELLGLITFFTVGPEEIRAWKIRKGAKAPEAGGAIHSDFQEKFIKAIVVDWQDLIKKGGFSKATKRIEGKNYTVQDGDVVEIKHGA